jgi:hypothetical protein
MLNLIFFLLSLVIFLVFSFYVATYWSTLNQNRHKEPRGWMMAGVLVGALVGVSSTLMFQAMP